MKILEKKLVIFLGSRFQDNITIVINDIDDWLGRFKIWVILDFILHILYCTVVYAYDVIQ